jgi:hypothetical protein
VVKAENIRLASPGALVGNPYENILETAGTWQGGNGEDSSVVYVDGAVEKGNMLIGDISGRPRCSGRRPGTNKTTVCATCDAFYSSALLFVIRRR